MSTSPPDDALPALEWPPLSPAARKRLQQVYEHGKKLMTQPKYDFNYAHTMFAECVLADPGNFVYVEALLANLSGKFKDRKKPATMTFFTNRGPLNKALKAQDWSQVIRAALDLIKDDPWQVAALRALAQACEQYQFGETELRFLKMALDGSPKDLELVRHAARSLGRLGQFDQAITMWGRVKELKRNDEEADRMASNLHVEKMQHRGGLSRELAEKAKVKGEGQGSAPIARQQLTRAGAPEIAPKPAVAGEPASWETASKRAVQLTRSQQLEQALVDEPTEIENYWELANIYIEEGKPPAAERVLTKAMTVGGPQPRFEERLEDVQMQKARQQLAQAEKQVAMENTEDARDLAQSLRESTHRLELDIYTRRRQRYPGQRRWILEAALRLKRLGNFAEALKSLGEIPATGEFAAVATLESGECAQQLRQFPRALAAYRSAIELAAQEQNETLRKLALYRAGTLGIAMKDAQAMEWLKELVRLDANYKDAKARLDKLTSIAHNT